MKLCSTCKKKLLDEDMNTCPECAEENSKNETNKQRQATSFIISEPS